VTTLNIITISAAYAVLGVVLLLMGLRSPWKWWIKGAAIVVTCSFFVVSFYKTRQLLGWPIVEKMPDRFSLLWVRVVEPNRAYQEPGAIYLWVEALDENNVASGVPRAYKVRYSTPLAEKAERAKEQIMQGNQLEGSAEDMAADENRQETSDNKASSQTPPPDAERAEQGNVANLDLEFLKDQPQRIEFMPRTGPVLPVKGPAR
jgi:hypothetical protein